MEEPEELEELEGNLPRLFLEELEELEWILFWIPQLFQEEPGWIPF